MSDKARCLVRYLTDEDVPMPDCGLPRVFSSHQPHTEPTEWNHVVYEAYAEAGGQALYVGLTANFGSRWRAHTRTSLWQHEARYVVITFAPCLDLTRRYEHGRIRALRPLHNRQGNPDWEAQMAARTAQKRRPRIYIEAVS